MALHAYSHSADQRPALTVVESLPLAQPHSRTRSVVLASVSIGVPFFAALLVLGAGR